MRNVDQEVVELGHVLEAGADRGQCSLQIFEALRRLRREIARLAGALAVASYPSCPAIDCAPRTGHLDDVGLAIRFRDAVGIGELEMRRDTLRLHERHAARRRRHNAGAHQHPAAGQEVRDRRQ